MKFVTKRIRQYPPHRRHCYCTTLKNKKVDFCRYSADMKKCKQIFIFSVFKTRSLSPYRLQIKFTMSLFFFLFNIVINLWHQKFVTADVIALFVNKQHGIQRRNKILIKSLYLKRYTQRGWQTNFLKKSWTKHGVNKLLKKLRNTGTVYIATKRNHTTTGSF